MTQSDRDIVFSEYPQRAPEYTENILWHRVALAGFLALALVVLLLWGAARLIGGGSEPEFDPAGLPATAALPETPEAETQAQNSAPDQSENMFAKAGSHQQTADAEPVKAAETRTITVSERPLAKENNKTVAAAPASTAGAQVEASANARANASPTAQAIAETVDKSKADQFRSQIAVERLDAQVTRAALSQEMDGVEPKTELSSMSDLNNDDFIRLYFFTDIKGKAGDTLTYHWIREGKTAARVRIPVHSNRWRSHSSKNITAKMRGHWEVIVTDKAGKTLARTEFDLPAAGS